MELALSNTLDSGADDLVPERLVRAARPGSLLLKAKGTRWLAVWPSGTMSSPVQDAAILLGLERSILIDF